MTTVATNPASPPVGYLLHGSGPRRVLVMHDWMGDHTNYDAVLPYLDTTAFTYAFLDLRGYGKSEHLQGAHTVEEIAGDALALADHLGWARFHVLGHSITGMAAQRLALDGGDRIQSVVAVSPMGAAGSPASDEALRFFASTIDDDEAFIRLIRFLTGGLSAGWAAMKLRQNRGGVSRERQRAYLPMFRTNFLAEVQGLETPFLVVVGDKDPGIDEAAMQSTFLSWYPNAQLRILPNCGHYPMQECPPFFAQVVEEYLLGRPDGLAERMALNAS